MSRIQKTYSVKYFLKILAAVVVKQLMSTSYQKEASTDLLWL